MVFYSNRVCTCCQQEKEVSHFHLKGTDKSGGQRYQSVCKDCANSSRIARYQKKKESLKPAPYSNFGNYSIEMHFHQDGRSSPDLKKIMNDYIEALYANSNAGIRKDAH